MKSSEDFISCFSQGGISPSSACRLKDHGSCLFLPGIPCCSEDAAENSNEDEGACDDAEDFVPAHEVQRHPGSILDFRLDVDKDTGDDGKGIFNKVIQYLELNERIEGLESLGFWEGRVCVRKEKDLGLKLE